MYKEKMVAIVSSKGKRDIGTNIPVMELKYKIADNVLWITDHRGHIYDFDLDEHDVEIKTIKAWFETEVNTMKVETLIELLTNLNKLYEIFNN